MCVGWTGQLVSATTLKPFLAINGVTDITVANFGEYLLEEVEVNNNY